MRFLFGLISGAIATLLVATAMNAPTDQVVHQLAGLWREAAASLAASAPPAPAEETHVQQQTAPGDPAAPGPVPPDTAPAPQPAPVESMVDAAAPAAPAPTPPPDPELAVDAPSSDPAELSPVEPGQAVVWAPFHSEASARGFAARLTNQLARPFYVEKQSAANYLVVFDYADAAERNALEQQISIVTGRASR